MHQHFLTLLTFLLLLLSTTSPRRLLHHPLFPADLPSAPSPSPSPQPPPSSTHPKYPFSTLPSTSPLTTPSNPFFPSSTSPPPPLQAVPSTPTTTFPTFPANISSLVIPSSSHSSHHPKFKLISLILSISLFSSLLFAFLLLLLHRRHHPHPHHPSLKSDSLRLFPPDTTPSDTTTTSVAIDASKKPPPPLFPRHTAPASSTSSEFLYLGTLVSSRDADYSSANNHISTSPALTTYHRLASPDLHPLPPLPRQQSHQNTTGHLTTSSEEDENENDNNEENDDEFFSPRGSTVNNRSPYHTRSSPKSKTLNSSSPTYSISPDNSPSVVLNSGSPHSLLSKSPDSSVTFPAPIPRFIPPPPPREPRTFSPFSPSSTDDCGTRDCSPRPSDVSGAGVFPPPPPPPPARLWEGCAANGPPELVAPSRKVVVNGEKGNLGNLNEELVKPKLKPLHWDKVKACSDRAMVWDHLKSSSFQ